MFPSRVMLIDDDQDDGYVFDLVLKSLPAKIDFQHFKDSELALKTLSDPAFIPPDLLFLDWNMPKLSGRQCLPMIRAIPGYADVPIIITAQQGIPTLRKKRACLALLVSC